MIKVAAHYKYFLSACGLIFVVLCIRVYNLHADPPPSFDIQLISDEGWWVHNARNKALFDKWIMDEFNQSLFISPTFCLLVYGSFKLFGVGFFAARLPSALAGVFLTLVIGAYVRRSDSPGKGIAAASLIGLNYSFICLNRVAFVDSLMLLYVTPALLLISAESKRFRSLLCFLAGILFGLGLCTKSYSLALIPVFITYWIYEIYSGAGPKKIINHCLFFALGAALTLLVWFKLVYLPFSDDFALMYSLWSDGNLPHSYWHALKNAMGLFAFVSEGTVTLRSFISQNALLLLCFWLLVLDRILLGESYSFKNLPKVEALCHIWIAWSFLVILPLTAKPLRRYIFLIPPLVILCARYLLDTIDRNRTILQFKNLSKKRLLLVAVWIATPLALLLLAPTALLLQRFIAPRFKELQLGSGAGVHLETTVFLAGALLLPVWVPIVALAIQRFPLTIRLRRLPLLGLVIGVEIVKIVFLLTTPTFSQYETSRQLGELFDENTRVLGGVADSLCLENKAFSLAIWGRQEARRVLNERPIERYNPHYLMIVRKLDVAWPPEQRYLKYARPENFLRSIRVLPKDHDFRVVVDLYSLAGVTE